MNKYVLLLSIAFCSTVQASDFYFPVGTVSNTSVAGYSFWAVVNNPSVTAFYSNPEIGVNYESRFGLKELSVSSVGLVYPVQTGTVFSSFQHYGYSVYHEMRFSIGYSRAFGEKFGGAVQFNLLAFRPDPETQELYSFSADVSLYAKPSDKLNLGFNLINIPSAKFKDDVTIQVPVMYRFGLDWKISDSFDVLTEISAKNGQVPNISGGVCYELIKDFKVLAGVAGNPVAVSAGVMYSKWNLHPGISCSVIRQIGKIWNCSVSYGF
ncbi:hypothetical protein ACE1ET_16905 [Saccharicrinis sp. FJH62]|uniref:hypothetical protein n=1 Tax=Saccharicrinis sp. FJH62 TaxID=3344657 RepID=UPI0035D4EAF0